MYRLIVCIIVFCSVVFVAFSQNIKYASDFGFSVEADGESNSDALQSALNGGGKIIVDKPGVYDISKTIFVDSNTELCFEDGVILNKCRNNAGGIMSHMFINRHAFEREYDENIIIKGLSIQMNGLDNGSDVGNIQGLCGTVSFFYIKNLLIKDFTSVGGGYADFTVQVCTFDSIRFENVYIEGLKDGIHLGRGKNFVIRNGKFKTYDDPIALNAHDYNISNPELGWIENGLIENCYDLEDGYDIGFFCRILAGAWPHWKENMKFQNSDAVISNGKIYRLSSKEGEKELTSSFRPTHDKGTKTYDDGLTWTLTQENDIVDHCGVRNVHFKNIYLQKERGAAFSFHFDNDRYSRSYYPDCPTPVQSGIVLENIYQQNKMDKLVFCITPVDTIKIINSVLNGSWVEMCDVQTSGCDYGTQYVIFDNVLFNSVNSNYYVVRNLNELDVKVDFRNCRKNSSDVNVTVSKNVDIVVNDVTGLVDCSVDNVEVYVIDGTLCVYSSEEILLDVYNVEGCFVRKIRINAGMNEFHDFENGMYIVSKTKVIL